MGVSLPRHEHLSSAETWFFVVRIGPGRSPTSGDEAALTVPVAGSGGGFHRALRPTLRDVRAFGPIPEKKGYDLRRVAVVKRQQPSATAILETRGAGLGRTRACDGRIQNGSSTEKGEWR